LAVVTEQGRRKAVMPCLECKRYGSEIQVIVQIVQAIGAAENNVLDFRAPKRIDGDAAINLVDAAVQTEADQFVMVTSLGTGKFGWPSGTPITTNHPACKHRFGHSVVSVCG